MTEEGEKERQNYKFKKDKFKRNKEFKKTSKMKENAWIILEIDSGATKAGTWAVS